MIATSLPKALFVPLFFFFLLPGCAFLASGQSTEEKIKSINQRIDNAVVEKDVSTLKEFYGDDFVFTHGTGVVDSKDSWIKALSRPEAKFISRRHDSTQVELHGDIAILTGILNVRRADKDGESGYGLRYVRVFALRKKTWQLISHRTTHEWHL